MDAKYTTVDEVHSRLTSLIKGKQVNKGDILEWSVECEAEFIQDYSYFVKYLKTKLPVRDLMARVPFFKARILDVYEDPDDRSSRVNYYDNGRYLILGSEYRKDHVYVNFIGLPIDQETGIPLIKRNHVEACVRHVMVNMYEEDYLNNKIDQNRWNYLLERRLNAVRAAQSDFSDLDKHDLNKIKIITMSFVPPIIWDSFTHEELGG